MTDYFADLESIGKPKIGTVEEQGKTFYVRSLGSMERAIYVQCMAQAIAEKSAVPDHVTVALGMCKPDGSMILPYKQAVERVKTIEGELLYKLSAKILELSGFGMRALRAAEKNETPAGTSVPVPAGVVAG